MQPSPAALQIITRAEGFRTSPYLDTSNIWTVGYGHALKTPAGQNIDQDVFGAQKARELAQQAMQTLFGAQVITEAQARQALTKDLTEAVKEVNDLIKSDTNQNQFDALVSFTYNVGGANTKSSSLLRFHNAGQRTVGVLNLTDLCKRSKDKKSPDGIPLGFCSWSNSGGHWTLGLFRRRAAEAMVYGGMDAAKALEIVYGFHD